MTQYHQDQIDRMLQQSLIGIDPTIQTQVTHAFNRARQALDAQLYQDRTTKANRTKAANAKIWFHQTYPKDYHNFTAYDVVKTQRIRHNADILHHIDTFKYQHQIYSSAELSLSYGLSESLLHDWYNGNSNPSIISIIEIANHEHLFVSQLVDTNGSKSTYQVSAANVKYIPDNIAKAFEASGLSQREACRQMQCSFVTFHSAMHKVKNLRLDYVKAIANVLKVSIDDLVYPHAKTTAQTQN